MATAKMKIILPLVVWIIWLHTTTAQSFGGIGFGIKREVFFLNLEDGYFGCQVNESTDVLQLFELSKLCDGIPNCFLGSDELTKELKCTDNCRKEDGTECQNGACLDGLCHCNDGYGGCSCEVPDENECKYRPCDVFAHCTNTLGSFSCTCFPGYQGDGFHCEDINECEDPAVAARCVENAECCNLPAHFLCKCNPGFQGDGEVQCLDINECANPNACGQNALCHNTPGNYTCTCPEGFIGNPFDGCVDVDECEQQGVCGPGAICRNVVGGRECHCPPGYEGDPYTTGCGDMDECSRSNPCGREAQCTNLEGSFKCACPPGFIGDPMIECTAAECNSDLECPNEKACINFQCIDPCSLRGACGLNALCTTVLHRPRCSCPECHVGMANTICHPDPKCQSVQPRPAIPLVCRSDLDCSNELGCDLATGKCQDPCENPLFKCRGNKKCEVHRHRPTCVCKKGFVVNEQGEISCAPDHTECNHDGQCPKDKACIEGLCQNPCTVTKKSPCPPEKSCEVLDHKPICICLKNCSPSLSICLRDNGCPSNQACRAFRCEDPCATANCAKDTPCYVEDHRPICKFCPPGYMSDAKYGCIKDVSCQSEIDCPSQQACIHRKCQNPCAVSNPCTQSQDCQVQDHQPVCVKVCQCQKDADCGNLNLRCDGCKCITEEPRVPQCQHCPPGVPCDPVTGACQKEPPSDRARKPCESDMDCLESEACYMSLCQDPCEFTNSCADSARCQAKMHRPICTCPMGYEGNPATKCFKSPTMACTSNEDCPINEACIDRACQRPCDVRNPCAQHAVCINTNHGFDCSCEEGFQGNGYVLCNPVPDYRPICQYNEDCPPNKLCDRLNRICISPCFEDSCGENAECVPKDHGIDCRCLPGYQGNAYVLCNRIEGCRSNGDCPSHEACINGQCSSPCKCGFNAICEVVSHKPSCKCPPGYQGNAFVGCQPPTNPCDPNPCGLNALCEIDNGNPICFCPKGLTGNPFKNCIPEGDECSPNPCGPNSGCRVVGGNAVCFCLPEFEGTPPQVPCSLPTNPCDPSPCGPNTQCAILSNGFAKCTCLPGFLESPNTIRGCIEAKNPCDPNPCGAGAVCDSLREPVCSCPVGTVGNPFKQCTPPRIALCNPGPCGLNADCYITNNQEQCFCRTGFIGNPYSGCRIQPLSPCVPNPCGPGAECIVTRDGNSLCQCPDGMGGDPTGPAGCHGYECVVDENCFDHQACIGYRCKDPCPGSCGINANCRVEKHHPVCTCNPGLTGNPVIRCFPVIEPIPGDPCVPSPCGLNTICQVMSGRAVCSCLPDFQGDPQFGCKPECVINSDCPINKACLDRHCRDPCSNGNLCGINAVCQVRDHTAACVCKEGYRGDPFSQCILTPTVNIPPYANTTIQPCVPSPCGAIECSTYGPQVAICDPCLGPDAPYLPQCRPECLTNADCPFDQACLGYKCIDPCPGSCGVNALCTVVSHTPVCSCPPRLIGDPFQHCSPTLKPEERIETCENVRCGANADCKQQNKGLACICKQGYYGNPWIACRPECVINPDCPLNKACTNNKCIDPCVGVCGVGAQCSVANHVPVCFCPPHTTGDAFITCYKYTPRDPIPPEPSQNPCDPSPCGPFSRCLVSHQGFATCSCLPNYYGAPPVCKPECVVSSDCHQTRACINRKCVDPCVGTCGSNAVCNVINHNPICTCPPDQEGDPFFRCTIAPSTDKPAIPKNPCIPSPCGPNSICQVKEDRPVCSCIANYIGSPPYCRPECTINDECPPNKACSREKCVNPCINVCGTNAKCNVVNHIPLCSCVEGFEGDAFIGCSKVPKIVTPKDPCNPSPCAENSQCADVGGVARCTCIPPYIGNPYVGGCRPECTTNSECPNHLACLSQHCRNPCQGLCGVNAECSVVNHVPVCTCDRGLIGDPFTACREPPPKVNPCEPSPCGPNSVCRVRNDQAICSCQIGYFGTPPSCRPECLVSSECNLDRACINQRCQDPCPGTCGAQARCQVNNHNPICSCPPNYIGDPFVQCTKQEKTPDRRPVPCVPSPCGANAECRAVDDRAVCSCLPGMYGAPPNCRPECVIDQDCPLSLACIRNKCGDPCAGSCGFSAQCNVVNHRPICSCPTGFEGDPFSDGCNPIPTTEPTPTSPCSPSPCGPNAECRERNGAGACICLPGYEGDPYDNNRGCHRECETSPDCVPTLACIAYKCVDPCPGTCGTRAECHVNNHVPTCICPATLTGDPFFQCNELPPPGPRVPEDPCKPSPCGPNSQCRNVNNQAVCSCLPNYIGSPPKCRPECVVNSECTLDRACLNQKCVDPCPNTCGLGAQCTTKNHNPICACPPGYTGDPFTKCSPRVVTEPTPTTERPPSCTPSPCGPNSQCRIVGNTPSCSCLPHFIGTPPNCRPECILNTECNNQFACINQKCKNPCPGSCGGNAECHVINHVPICTCITGHTGDPFTHCNLIPPVTIPPPPTDPCNPSPCGPNAVCDEGVCSCIPEYIGNPYESCRPECVLSTECSRDKACIRNKCVDPCPGTCGQNARCDVINHIPTCSCPDGFAGDPFTNCRVASPPPSRKDPCNPSPCGSNSLCKNIDDHAVCSCIQGYQGSPPSCKPECVVSGECPSNRACVNQKCIDPCPGSCGIRARCEVRNHSPICSCPEGQTGDPFQSCRDIPIERVTPRPEDPCQPSPCGPNSLCKRVGDSPSCTCQPNYIGNPPNCRPECVINPDCPNTEACINNKCKDPCPGSCGENAECRVVSHMVTCSCSTGFTGNPFIQCIIQKQEIPNPCEPSPCGANAECKERNGAGACMCIQDYQGNPYEGCRPECVLSSDCETNKACIRNKCADPCPGTCGQNAECSVINHVPACTCISGYSGDPFIVCSVIIEPPVTVPSIVDPCSQSPCGPYSQCRNVNDQAVCSCLPEYTGSPPHCKPECVVSSECPSNRACHKFKCANPCGGTCGIGARCEVINHNPICSCPAGLTGDPFTRCYELPPSVPEPTPTPLNPCIPSPCGSNSECRVIGDQASCSCRSNYMGTPPNCRPECVVNTDCPSYVACIAEKCKDPCPGSCGFNTECRVQNHIPICTCAANFTGDAFTECTRITPPKVVVPVDPCNPSPCGQNTECDNGICSCLPLYQGDPYIGCRPECTMNTDCSPNKACKNVKCVDPCPGTCGQGATCDVVNHIPACSCPTGYEGDPFTSCRLIKIVTPQNPCQPSPCGPNSVCRVNNDIAVCSCQPGLIGSPPTCRPECVVSAECPLTQACINNKCIDPCPGTCGISAKCQVINHNPICSCTAGNTGDPFTRCYALPPEDIVPKNPCDPSPCGPNSVCQVRGESPACSCVENYVGMPPNCRPECTINPECPNKRACINQKCKDPCPGSCGSNAVCSVVNHNALCTCLPGYVGDPFQACVLQPATPTVPPSTDACVPSPCGPNAHCRVENEYAVCECLPEYHGNPYEVCRPECLTNADCPMNRACISNKCQDPCPGTCGFNALCTVTNHVPVCSCPDHYSGDAFRLCTPIIVTPPTDPCNPSPCGINTACRQSGENAICECLPGFFGVPSAGGCKPECTISADCSRDKACVNTKCVDPCPGVCGFKALCNVINHSPICSCPSPLIGDPFSLCQEPLIEPPQDPCNPSPCNLNGQCRVVNGVATCVYPECVINQDCPRDKACYSQKCRDPCRDSCGLNALCQVVNHKAVCSCPQGYTGSPQVQCRIQPTEPLQPKVECTQDTDCTNDNACVNSRCVNPCSSSPGICGQNAECHPQLHRAVCSCREGFTGNAKLACYEIGCRSDSECPSTQACINRECTDPCSFTSCGLNALCRAGSNHKARCYCPDNFRGDPFVRCERPECVTDEECPYNLACRNERCEDPCNCGPGAACKVLYHRAQCSCPPGYTGNPLVSCTREVIKVQPQCRMDSDCPSKLACFGGVCKNPCFETKPCGLNAECIVVDSLPLRTMSCMCLPGYVGDADTECKLAQPGQLGCKRNDECSSSEACLNAQCINPCAVGNPCALTANCTPLNHKAMCKCPAGLEGNPFIRCSEKPKIRPECTSDSECSNDKSCINQACQNPCTLANPCGSDAECQTHYHRPICNCPNGWIGNPQVQCYKPECQSDNECPYDRACINENCVDPCLSHSCGRGAECKVFNHHAQCQCPAGTQGDPLLSCITGICHYNEDCADHEACDRLNRVCRPVCDEDTCADSAICKGQQHQPKCHCPQGTTGNPFIRCTLLIPPPHGQPECRSDPECPTQMACINQKCVNPCVNEQVCKADQECRVLDTSPLRTVMCQCPPDTFVDSSGRCVSVRHEQCHVDNDCSDREKCIRGTCIEACKIDRCGVNALCNSFSHQAACTCAPGYTGNAHVECTTIHITPPVILPPECYIDSDCTYDKTCRGGYCVNPCREDNPCAVGAFCSVNRHEAVCRCPAQYIGNPKIECIAPLGPTVGCTSNSECPKSESCINHLCVSPCNCGPNAECKVVNHYATCYCQPGYSGNPQLGCIKLGCQSDNECADDKQCYNGKCVNPCILEDPCARNAECYGSYHKASCRCFDGYEGNPFTRCERVECHSDNDCPNNKACLQRRCIDPCSSIANPPCAQNAICYAQNHAAGCVCPSHLPEGNPLSYCTAISRVPGKPECELDVECPSKLACIRNKCVNPCESISPCHPTAHCSVLDTVPVRTMICTCPEGWVPNENGECHAVIVPIPPGCISDDDCPNNEACINRLCRNPCDCGTNANCYVQNHRAVCSCTEGFEGNPNIACHAVGCRIDSECESGKACVNGHCINPCLVKDPCGINAECYVYQNHAECRCLSGYRGDPFDRCIVVGCTSNSDCPSDRQCINAQCINPCVFSNPCSSRAECKVQNHLSLCRCPPGLIGNPYVDCRPEPQPECREDRDCPSRLACLSNKCQDPCAVLEPCRRPSECQVVDSVPLRTMICICPPGYISSGSGTCSPVTAVIKVACVSDGECPADKACFNGLCKNPCTCGPNAECRVKNHKPVCTCRQGFDGNPELDCHRVGCRSDDECSGQHSCVNRQCVPVCAADGSSCGEKATCYGYNHRSVCECPPGLKGNPKVSCILVGCRSDTDCPGNRACINDKCELPCEVTNPCDTPAECKAFNHIMECVCPPGTVSDGETGCLKIEEKCRKDSDCPSQYACIGGECLNPCKSTEPCGINAECTVLNTEPVRTMICQCLPGYQGNAAVQCDKRPACPPNTVPNNNNECIPCSIEKGFKVDEQGNCVCALEKGFIIDERGNCVCPIEFGYYLDSNGNCIRGIEPKCVEDSDCSDNKYCNLQTKSCEDPCPTKQCGNNAFCKAINHQAVCHCIDNYEGNPEENCTFISRHRTTFPRPDLIVSCLSDGVQVEITLSSLETFSGILYVKGHSKDENCRRMISTQTGERTEYFKVKFGSCGLIHINGEASFVLVIQKHPILVTTDAQAYHIKCVYQTGEQNVTLGFNVSMLTTAGTIANTGPPPTCLMKIITPTGEEINSAEIGDNLMLQVDVQPGTIYGGFARSCVAKTMENNVENEYLVTDENGCATDPTIFGEWEYSPDSQSLQASFNAFKFPSSDNIKFQCNIRVCFGKCQPVNCRGYNAFGRRKRAIDSENNTDSGGDLLAGQLREEITIQSNAIITFERREERGPDSRIAPNAQRVEDICVSMIGFIIALIITALLALVAVAVAVSCWLMAYRRRPKATGPLPHPPEFPNPLFTTPEPMAEPSPDYLT